MRYKSPVAAVELPLLVNRESALQAASPAFETARLLSLVGVGVVSLAMPELARVDLRRAAAAGEPVPNG